eukprot:m.354069 g.354069  ORF g.354069 m.354069 type:complete len:394 (+) comp16912_c0_seq1:30-1211(+)
MGQGRGGIRVCKKGRANDGQEGVCMCDVCVKGVPSWYARTWSVVFACDETSHWWGFHRCVDRQTFAMLNRFRSVAARSMGSARMASTLVYVDHNGTTLAPAVANTISAAKQLGGDCVALVAGGDDAVVEQASKLGVSKVIHAPGSFDGQTAEAVTNALRACQDKFSFSHILAPATTAGKNILPRLAAQLDVSMLSEITEVESEDTFSRFIYAGNALAQVKSSDPVKVITVRTTSFDPAPAADTAAPVEQLDGDCTSALSSFVSQELTKSERPQLETAKIVVSGGRALKDSAEFERLIFGLADKVGAAVGATRAAVDGGICASDLQVGQTGKIVAPDLYIAIGISGAIQHLAGMKDSKTIVAINKDGEAPIFSVADYGLEADLFKAVPEMMEKL